MAALAEEKKAKYLDLAQTHYFIAVVVVTDFFADIGSQVRAVSNEAQSRSYILQQVSAPLTVKALMQSRIASRFPGGKGLVQCLCATCAETPRIRG